MNNALQYLFLNEAGAQIGPLRKSKSSKLRKYLIVSFFSFFYSPQGSIFIISCSWIGFSLGIHIQCGYIYTHILSYINISLELCLRLGRADSSKQRRSKLINGNRTLRKALTSCGHESTPHSSSGWDMICRRYFNMLWQLKTNNILPCSKCNSIWNSKVL